VDATIPLTEATREPVAIAVIDKQISVLGSRQHRVEFFSPAGERRGELRWDGVRFPTTFAFDAANRRFLVANPQVAAVEIFDEEGRGLGAFGQLGDRLDQQRRIETLHVDPHGLAYLVDSYQGNFQRRCRPLWGTSCQSLCTGLLACAEMALVRRFMKAISPTVREGTRKIRDRTSERAHFAARSYTTLVSV